MVVEMRKGMSVQLMIIVIVSTLTLILTLTPIIGGIVAVDNPDLGLVESNLDEFRGQIESQCGSGSTFQTNVRTYTFDPKIDRVYSRPDGLAADLEGESAVITSPKVNCDGITICQPGGEDDDVAMDCSEGEFSDITEEATEYKAKYDNNNVAIMPVEEE